MMYLFLFFFINDSLTASDSLRFQFATDGEGNYGYLGADDSFIPFKRGCELKTTTFTGTSYTMEFDEPPVLSVVHNNTNVGISAYYNNTNDKKRWIWCKHNEKFQYKFYV